MTNLREALLLAALSTTALMTTPALAETVLRLDEVPVGELDPGKASDYADSILMFNVYDTLVQPSAGKPGMEPMLAASWAVDGNVYTFNICGGGQNDSHYCNAELDGILNKARHVADPAERKKLYDQANEIILRDVPRLILWHRRVFTGHSAKVTGFTPYPDGIIRLKGLKLQ